MLTSIRNIWRPDNYHGWNKRPPFFEGWYFKLVDPTETHALAVIPGVFLAADPADSHCFVQTLIGKTGHSTYHRYPLDQFHADRERFDVRIGPNHFNAQSITLDIAAPERTLRGEVRFADTTPWPVTALSPGIMDWYTFTPFMQCYHGVVSLDHSLGGTLAVDGQEIDFTQGRGYIEKDWGRSFPKAWVWMQTNHFAQPGVCLSASVATIPWLGTAFRGFIIGFLVEGTLYRFATYTGAKITRLGLTDTHVIWHISGRTGPQRQPHTLEIRADRAEGGLLHEPAAGQGAMLQRVMESLTAQVHVRLVREDGLVIFDDIGRHAGLEISGQLDEILDA